MFTRTVLTCVTVLVLAGCGTIGNLDTVHREFDLEAHQSQWVDATQRAVFIAKDDSNTRTKTIICAEPSPDALAVFSASVGAKLSSGKVSGEVSAAVQAQAISLAQRTAGIQLLRDAYYRLCESYISGAINKSTYDFMLRRMETDTIAFLAIDGLTAAAAKASPPAGQTVDSNPPKAPAPNPQPGGGQQQNGGTTPPPATPNTGSQTKTSSEGKSDSLFVPISLASSSDDATKAAEQSKTKKNSKAHTPPKKKRNQKKGSSNTPEPPDTSNSDAGPKSGESVASAVQSIVGNIINRDYGLSMCFSYYTDGDSKASSAVDAASQQTIVNYCNAVILAAQNAASVGSLRGSIATAFAGKCLDPLNPYKEFCSTLAGYLKLTSATSEAAANMLSSANEMNTVNVLKYLYDKKFNDLLSPPGAH